MKRLLDICLTIILLVILLPIMILVALLIFIFDLKTPFFLQERIGVNKHPFTILKFRTMVNDKVTFHGKLWRKTGLDELPQLWNILKGDMSFVGPRPLTQGDIERLNWQDEYYNIRWKMRPGLVGLAQLSPICHKKMSWFLDKYYIDKHTSILDMRIMLSSCLVPIVGKTTMKKWIHKR